MPHVADVRYLVLPAYTAIHLRIRDLLIAVPLLASPWLLAVGFLAQVLAITTGTVHGLVRRRGMIPGWLKALIT